MKILKHFKKFHCKILLSEILQKILSVFKFSLKYIFFLFGLGVDYLIVRHYTKGNYFLSKNGFRENRFLYKHINLRKKYFLNNKVTSEVILVIKKILPLR